MSYCHIIGVQYIVDKVTGECHSGHIIQGTFDVINEDPSQKKLTKMKDAWALFYLDESYYFVGQVSKKMSDNLIKITTYNPVGTETMIILTLFYIFIFQCSVVYINLYTIMFSSILSVFKYKLQCTMSHNNPIRSIINM